MRILKDWLTLSEAGATCLSVLGYTLSEADLAQLALEGKLSLSAMFPDGAEANVWNPVNESDIEYHDVPSIDGKSTIRLPVAGALVHAADGCCFQSSKEIVWLDDESAFDLALIGGERAHIMNIRWGGARNPTVNIDGAFLTVGKGPSRRLLGLQVRILVSGKETDPMPIGHFPEEAVIGVRHKALEDLIELADAGHDDDALAADILQSHRAGRDQASASIIAAADYLDPLHERFPYKLAAAVRAWLSVDGKRGRSPKEVLEGWLTEHAAELGLVKEDGTLNREGIRECAKVANWRTQGGVPKTPDGEA